ncbi:MAG: transcriptional regulator [Syntrophales bacterium]|nr:transcriptional regulator [Syntrophales bacterium]
MAREMKIGIMSRDDFKKYTMAIAGGEIKPGEDQPKVWFDSLESMAQVLSTKNRELLKIIKEEEPNSLRELSDASGRRVSNLSRTLKTMEIYGIVKLEKQNRAAKPSVCVENFQAVFGI